ncbi:FAD-linked oxidoreductase sor8 [Trichoderma asperellum]|uniref:FAD-linked oxidoreductase sor8 n=1 Tax=Trichoderma asperellum TaxID=101201 RepID=A0A6V8QV41_TRIAP|nr:FAD-linked oxidoreductase sor8 [Trichoderma asperellum]
MAWLISLLAIVPALVSAAAVNTTCVTEPSCRCLPSDSCWPSKSEWTAFNKTVGGRLIATVPIGSVCHNSAFGSYNAQKCDELRSVWDYPATHIASSSDPMAPFFANDSCDPFTAPSARCIIGTLVQYSVNASSSSDYLATIKFAQQNNIRLVIRNTGHDYYGKSSGTGALALWTHHLKDISLVNYKQSYYSGKALKVGAGVQNSEAQTFAHNNGLIVVTGDGASVGLAGGYSQGGGHGPVASKFGLAADQVLEWEVITSTGQHLVATPSQNTDLYWALSGGGGGTYAAVLSMTIRAYPDMPSSAANLTITNQGISDDAFYAAVQTFLTTLPSIVDSGATVVYLLAYGLFLVQPVNAPGVSKAQLQTLLNPTLSYLQKQNIPYDFHIDQFPTFLDSFNAYNPPPNVTEYNIGGRLIPRTLLESQTSATSVVNAYRFINEAGAVISGVNVNVSNGTKVPNSVNPVWRSSITSNVIGVPYDPLNFQNNIYAQNNVTDILIPKLEALSPIQGAYLNEANMHQPNFQSVFYGNNYPALKSIKNKYDPSSTFYGLTAVGSDDWTVDSVTGRLCPVS